MHRYIHICLSSQKKNLFPQFGSVHNAGSESGNGGVVGMVWYNDV